jgi:hypothetical protein
MGIIFYEVPVDTPPLRTLGGSCHSAGLAHEQRQDVVWLQVLRQLRLPPPTPFGTPTIRSYRADVVADGCPYL